MGVWGRKKWTIRNAPKLLPYTEEMLGKDDPVPDELIKAPVLEFTMEPHDILYIPRGYLHEAHTVPGEPSLHITVTVPTSDFCWGVQLVKQMVSKVTTQRGDLPPKLRALCNASLSARGRAGPAAMDDSVLDSHLDEFLTACLDDINVESTLHAFDQRMAKTNETQAHFFTKGQDARK